MKEKWRNRVISIIIIIVSIVSFTGCGKKEGSTTSNQSELEDSTIKVSSNFNSTGLPIMKQPITLKFMTDRAPLAQKGFGEKEHFKKMSEETNVNIEWEEIVGSAFKERIALAISSNDLPDALYAAPVPNFAEAIDGGLILPLNEYIDKFAPNQKKLYELYPATKLSVTYIGDGKIYAYAGIGKKPEAAVRAPLFINKVWLDKLGLKVPTTLDEFYTVLKAFKTMDPNGNGVADEIPLLFDKSNGTYADFLSVWGIIDVKTKFHTGIKDGKLIFNPIDVRYKEALSYMNKLFVEGLLDNDSLKHDRKTVVAKGSKKPAIIGIFTGYDIEMTIGTPNADEYDAMLPIKGPHGDRLWPYNPSELDLYRGFTVFKDCKYPEAAIRWVDHLNDGANAISTSYGPENFSWKRNESTKTWWTLDEELAKKGLALDDAKKTEGTLNGPEMSKIDEVTGYKFVPVETSRDGKKLKWSELYKPYMSKEFWINGMPITPSTDEGKEIAGLETEFNAYLNTFAEDIITTGQADQKWDAHLKKCNDLQVGKVVKYYQKMYDDLQKLMKK